MKRKDVKRVDPTVVDTFITPRSNKSTSDMRQEAEWSPTTFQKKKRRRYQYQTAREMTPQERRHAIAEILASGALRLARKRLGWDK
jgi:hypothetical protein